MSDLSKINFQQAKFLISAAKLNQCPPDDGVEVAFAGRSNAGKSSALNTLCRQTKLARTSKTPGRTQLINFFSLDEKRNLVDLPGYGFAKVPDRVKREWQQHLDDYLRNRKSLKGLVLVMDIRHPMKEFDQLMCDWARASEMPIHILLTKADKMKKGPANAAKLSVKKSLADMGDLATVQVFSSLKGQGIDQLQNKLGEWLQLDSAESDDSEN